MKKNKLVLKISICILIIIIIALIGVVIWGIISGNGFTFFEKPTVIYQETFEDIENVIVNVTSYDIEIKESEDTHIQVEISGSQKSKDKFNVEQENDTLSINQNGSNICIGFCLGGSITIYLPQEEITYTHLSNSGSLNSDVNLARVDIKTTSGDINLKNVREGTFSSTSGNIQVANAYKLSASTTSGDISLDEVEDLVITSQSGHVKVGSVTYKMDITTNSGAIDISSLNIKEDSKIEAKSGNVDIKLNQELFIDVSTKSGNIDINNTNASPSLSIHTTSGDITAK